MADSNAKITPLIDNPNALGDSVSSPVAQIAKKKIKHVL